ncbi:MAG: SMC-Scp complex subunit ScpB [Pyrinomonadaceae bacterium MAG19_C2-C3]|nr:SMC-Scp complex subunit ScpB [Pyrinomonadaceae bacterium MAG19_C2-C3]
MPHDEQSKLKIDELLNTDDQDSAHPADLDDAESIIEGIDSAFMPEELAAENDDDDDDEDDDDEDAEIIIYDVDAEDIAEAALAARAVMLEDAQPAEASDVVEEHAQAADEAVGSQTHSIAELMAIIEALIFVSDEPLPPKRLAEVLTEDRATIEMAIDELVKEFNERGSGLMLREIAGGWQLATRPEHHEHLRAFLKSQPSAKLSLPALETLAVIAYKQPVTVPEILEIRGVQSTSAIKTLLDKRLIISKGRKETVGRPMMYGTSKEFLMQFGLRDLTELPSIEDFEDLAGSAA